MRNFWPILILICALSACSDARDTVIPMERAHWDKELGSKLGALSPQEKELLSAYLKRVDEDRYSSREGALSMPIGTTVREAIQSEKMFQNEEKIRREQLKTISEKIEQEIAKSVDVKLFEKISAPKTPDSYSDVIFFYINFENKTQKVISGISGDFYIVNKSGEQIGLLPFKFDSTIEPGSVYFWNAELKVNKSNKLHQVLWSLQSDEFTTKFQLSSVLFKDGSNLTVPKF